MIRYLIYPFFPHNFKVKSCSALIGRDSQTGSPFMFNQWTWRWHSFIFLRWLYILQYFIVYVKTMYLSWCNLQSGSDLVTHKWHYAANLFSWVLQTYSLHFDWSWSIYLSLLAFVNFLAFRVGIHVLWFGFLFLRLWQLYRNVIAYLFDDSGAQQADKVSRLSVLVIQYNYINNHFPILVVKFKLFQEGCDQHNTGKRCNKSCRTTHKT